MSRSIAAITNDIYDASRIVFYGVEGKTYDALSKCCFQPARTIENTIRITGCDYQGLMIIEWLEPLTKSLFEVS